MIHSSCCRVSRQAVQAASRRFVLPLPCSIDFHGIAWLMTDVKDEQTVKTKLSFRKKLLVGISAFFLVVIGWTVWQVFAFNNAVQMAKEAGFEWRSRDPISLIREDWRNGLKKETWLSNDRDLDMIGVSDLEDYRIMLHVLSPSRLDLSGCIELQNVNALEGLKNLTHLNLSFCTKLENLDGLRDLPILQIDLIDCSTLENVDGLERIKDLKYLNLSGCHKIPAADLRELSAALPKTNIVFPDNTTTPPQE